MVGVPRAGGTTEQPHIRGSRITFLDLPLPAPILLPGRGPGVCIHPHVGLEFHCDSRGVCQNWQEDQGEAHSFPNLLTVPLPHQDAPT